MTKPITMQELAARFAAIGGQVPTIGEDGDVETIEQALIILENDEREFEREAEREAIESAAKEEAYQAHLLHADACEALVAALGGAAKFDRLGDRYASSSYFNYRGVTIRVSDHAQKPGGGWRVVDHGDGVVMEGRLGEADVCIRDSAIPTRAEIRKMIAEAIRAWRSE